jgi:hypothetical protein
MKSSFNINKVKKLLARINPLLQNSAKVKQVVRMKNGLLLLGTKGELWSYEDEYHTLTPTPGIVDGFNINAPTFAFALAELGLVTKKEADDFYSFFWAEEKREQRKSKELQLRRLAEDVRRLAEDDERAGA